MGIFSKLCMAAGGITGAWYKDGVGIYCGPC